MYKKFSNETTLFKNLDAFTVQGTGGTRVLNYNAFKTWYRTQSHFSDSDTDVPKEKTFWLIASEFMDSHVAFSDVDFYNHFAVKLYTYYKEFEKKTDIINSLLELTEEQVTTEYSDVSNTADVPETPTNTSATVVDYISRQNKLMHLKGKLQANLDLLDNKKAYTVDAFLAKFRPLFIKVVSPEYNYGFGTNVYAGEE